MESLVQTPSKRFTQPLTLGAVISVCSPTRTELKPSDLSNMQRQRIRKQWLSPLRKPNVSSFRSDSVNINFLIFIRMYNMYAAKIQKFYYYGYKPHTVCGLNDVIHSFDLTKANVHDIHYLQDVKYDYQDCSLFGDKGYIGAEVQLDLFGTANIRLEVPYAISTKPPRPFGNMLWNNVSKEWTR